MDGVSSVVKSGEVSIQDKGLFKTNWVKKFGVLHKKTEDSHPYLEFHDNRDAFDKHKLNKSKSDVKKVELQNVKYIKSSAQKTNKGTEYQIEIKCRRDKCFLMLEKESESVSWYKLLNAISDITDIGEEGSSYSIDEAANYDSDDSDDEVVTLNQMYAASDQCQRFTVDVEPTPLAKLCEVSGTMTLMIGPQELAFEKPESKEIKYRFNLSWMRRFGKKQSSQFYFECGRKCPNGEGTIYCNTASAKEIHNLITQQSKSRGKTVVPKATKLNLSGENHEKKDSPDPVKKSPLPISEASLATNFSRRHPGNNKVPVLIPLNIEKGPDDEDRSSPVTPSKNSVKKPFGSQKEKSDNNKGSVGKKKSTNIAKELEEKLHLPTGDDNDLPGSVKRKEESKSVKSKDEKKREKEEKKERERREKEEKKERERREKEERKEKERKEKEEKKKGKKKDENENNTSFNNSVRQRNNIYDEPEPLPDYDMDEPRGNVGGAEALYDEATPVGKKQTKSPRQSESAMYDEASSVSLNSSNVTAAPAEYALPYSKKGGVPAPMTEPVAYADVKSVERNAWKSHGRTEAEECFEEDYSNIKNARSQMTKDAPPIPNRGYNEDNDDDDTYNRLDLVHKQKPKPKLPPKTENLYGTASGKQVGPLRSSVPLPVAGSESEGEEDQYDEAGYEDTSIQNNSKPTTVSDAYEEAAPMLKTPLKPKANFPVHKEPLYEEVG